MTVIAGLFIVTGIVGLAQHWSEFDRLHPFEADAILGTLVRLLAIVCGVFMLRGHNWARWVALLWLAFHVGLSIFHSWFQTGMHALLLAILAYILLRPRAAEYFAARDRKISGAGAGGRGT